MKADDVMETMRELLAELSHTEGSPYRFFVVKNALALLHKKVAEVERLESLVFAQKMTISGLRTSLEKAKHDSDRYGRKIAELTEENKGLNRELSASEKLIDKAVEIVVAEMKLNMTLHFGTYTDKDTIKVRDVFEVIDRIAEAIQNPE